MAVILYRKGNAERVDPVHVGSCLANGYFLSREESLGESADDLSETEEITPDDVGSIEDVLGDDNDISEVEDPDDVTSDSDDVNSEDDNIRLEAESLSIEGWDTLDIGILKNQIELAHGNPN